MDEYELDGKSVKLEDVPEDRLQDVEVVLEDGDRVRLFRFGLDYSELEDENTVCL